MYRLLYLTLKLGLGNKNLYLPLLKILKALWLILIDLVLTLKLIFLMLCWELSELALDWKEFIYYLTEFLTTDCKVYLKWYRWFRNKKRNTEMTLKLTLLVSCWEEEKTKKLETWAEFTWKLLLKLLIWDLSDKWTINDLIICLNI